MLHYETIKQDTLELLKKIQSLDMFRDVRLVGGTSPALQLGHRKSIDLDFFGRFDATMEDIVAELSSFASVSPLDSSKLMRYLIVNGVKVDVVNYPYEWIDESISYTYRIIKKLSIYTTDGRYKIDDNMVENSIRPLVIGRKNYLFRGDDEVPQRAAAARTK